MSIDQDNTPALSPISNSTRREIAVASMRRALLSGELEPGQRIKETSTAAMLGISRPTVREAMNQLISEGSLVQEPYKGVRVAQPSAQDLIDVAEVRVSLETLAALKVARDPDGPGMASLRRALGRHLDALQADDPVAASRTHLDLHRTLWEASGNPMLTRILAVRRVPDSDGEELTRPPAMRPDATLRDPTNACSTSSPPAMRRRS